MTDNVFSLKRSFTQCAKCGRNLSNPQSVEFGMGPVCRRRALKAAEEKEEYATVAQLPFDPASGDIVCQRVPSGVMGLDGEPLTKPVFNISQSVVWHSPTGFEFGYAGSGPADFALNILHWFVPPARSKDAEKCPWWEKPVKHCARGAVTSAFASRYHQKFKFDYIAGMPREGGTIRGSVIRTWIRREIESAEHEQATIFDVLEDA